VPWEKVLEEADLPFLQRLGKHSVTDRMISHILEDLFKTDLV